MYTHKYVNLNFFFFFLFFVCCYDLAFVLTKRDLFQEVLCLAIYFHPSSEVCCLSICKKYDAVALALLKMLVELS